MRLIHATDMDDIALGAAVLGTGGGGDPYIGKLMAIQAIEEHGPVKLIEVDEIDDDSLAATCGVMGAPTVFIEKIPNGDEIVRAFQALEVHIGAKLDYTVSIEAGGFNSTTPFIVAASLRIPLVDADGMGRAFPEMQMVTATMFGISATPMAMADEKGNSAIIETIDNRWAETLARAIVVEMGATAPFAMYSMTGKQLKEVMIPGTITMAEAIGHTIRKARATHQNVVDAVKDVTGGFEIFVGKIVDVERRTERGFAKGEATFTGIDRYKASTLKLQFQNEHLVAIVDDEVVVSVPDLITVLDADTGEPVTTEGMRYGFRVVVVGIPCTPKWRTPEGLELVGPRYFGYDVDYVPVEQRYGA